MFRMPYKYWLNLASPNTQIFGASRQLWELQRLIFAIKRRTKPGDYSFLGQSLTVHLTDNLISNPKPPVL